MMIDYSKFLLDKLKFKKQFNSIQGDYDREVIGIAFELGVQFTLDYISKSTKNNFKKV